MESVTCTREEIAEKFGVSVRTVRSWERKGLLERVDEGGTPRYDRAQAERVQEAREEAEGLDTRYALVTLRYRVAKLERMVRLLETMHDVQREPFIPDQQEALGLVGACLHILNSRKRLDREEIEDWADLFLRINELTFEEIERHTGEERIWDVIYRLCLSLQKRVSKREGFRSSLELQTLHAKLDQGRKSLRESILLHLARMERIPEAEHALVYQPSAAPKEDLFRRLAQNKG